MATSEPGGKGLHFDPHFRIGLRPRSYLGSEGIAGRYPPRFANEKKVLCRQKQGITSEVGEASHGMR